MPHSQGEAALQASTGAVSRLRVERKCMQAVMVEDTAVETVDKEEETVQTAGKGTGGNHTVETNWVPEVDNMAEVQLQMLA